MQNVNFVLLLYAFATIYEHVLWIYTELSSGFTVVLQECIFVEIKLFDILTCLDWAAICQQKVWGGN